MTDQGAMPAYPCTIKEWEEVGGLSQTYEASYKGLTKREVFAMAAMQGLSANSFESLRARNMPAEFEIAEEARIAVQMADALLAALEQQQE